MADPIMVPAGTTKFQLDRTVLIPGGSATIEVGGGTDQDVINAILGNLPFPERPEGKIELGTVDLKAEAGKTFSFNAGPTSVSFTASADFKTGMGVFNDPADAMGSLQLDDAPELNLAMDGKPTDKFLVLMWAYDVSGSVSGSHPLGVFGTLTFGAEGSRDARYAVVHRFAQDTGADVAIADTVSSWRLPRHVKAAGDLKAGTWLVAEVDGSLALRISAQLGYDFNMLKELKLLGLTTSLSAKIDAGLKASVGFDVSGRYLLVVANESVNDLSNTVRLQLFKQTKRGLNFGLNLSVGITPDTDLPENLDGFLEAVFGVHGLQVVKDLHVLEKWTDPKTDLGQNVAGLLNDEGLKLLTQTTGIDAKVEFEKARQIVLGEFKKWDSLPERVSAATWKILATTATPHATAEFKKFLSALADADSDTRASAFADALQDVTFGETPAGQWLNSIADHGLLALSSQLDRIQPIAAQTLNILNGGIIKKLQDYISENLNLDTVRKAVTQNDFDTLDAWLVKRLGNFFDKDLHFEDLKVVQAAINVVLTKANDIYGKARHALETRYNIDFALNYAKNKTSTALLDVNFDLQQSGASALFRQVVDDSNLDQLLVTKVDGVSLNQATLSHDITRSATIQLNMPLLSFDSAHVNESLASLSAEEDSGRVLVYELSADDTVTVKNRYRSELSVLASLRVINGQLQLVPDETKAIAYNSRQVKAAMTVVDLEDRVTPFIQENLSELFSGSSASLKTFYSDLDRTVENVLHNGTNEFGDVALSMQVSVPAAVLSGWFLARDGATLKQDSSTLSRALQVALRRILPSIYFQESARLRANPSAAALLVWAAMPPSTSATLKDGAVRFNTDTDVFWNFPDVDLRHAFARDSHTAANLVPSLLNAQARLIDEGDKHNASFFVASSASSFQTMAISDMGDVLLQSLLFTEAAIIRGAVGALNDVSKLTASATTAPVAAIARFAQFGSELTDTFNKKLSSVFGGEILRTLSTSMLVEASRAIDPGFSQTPRAAMLSIITLNNNHTFRLSDFVSGAVPPKDQIALAQTLVNLPG